MWNGPGVESTFPPWNDLKKCTMSPMPSSFVWPTGCRPSKQAGRRTDHTGALCSLCQIMPWQLGHYNLKLGCSPNLGIWCPWMFGVLFPNRSFPLDISTFTQVDDHRWVLDMNYFVGEAYDQVKEMCIFLLNELVLPAGKALAVYVQSPGSQYEYRGAVHSACPSAVFPLLWPTTVANNGQMLLTGVGTPPLSAQIGVSIEDLLTLPMLNVGQQKRIEELALKVGKNLFNFMQSFCTVEGDKLLIPMDILNRWFKKFQDKAKRDPDYLNHFTL